MKLEVKKLAARYIARAGAWVENKNSEESGSRWIKKVYDTLESHAKSGVKYAPCKHEKFAKRGYYCFTYNYNWVVAYRIKENNFIVCRFIHGSYLK